MDEDRIRWSKTEKKIAQAAFEAAFTREMKALVEEVRRRLDSLGEPDDIWEIADLLEKRRRETDRKYDYRYSVLPEVFARLIIDGWLAEIDLEGLGAEKLDCVRRRVALFRELRSQELGDRPGIGGE